MSSLSPRLQLRVAQKQILTPGLVQMVTVLQLNRLELKDMIVSEIAQNLAGKIPISTMHPELNRNVMRGGNKAKTHDGQDQQNITYQFFHCRSFDVLLMLITQLSSLQSIRMSLIGLTDSVLQTGRSDDSCAHYPN